MSDAMTDEDTTACGATFEHDAHLYRQPRGAVAACDGVFRKSKEAGR